MGRGGQVQVGAAMLYGPSMDPVAPRGRNAPDLMMQKLLDVRQEARQQIAAQGPNWMLRLHDDIVEQMNPDDVDLYLKTLAEFDVPDLKKDSSKHLRALISARLSREALGISCSWVTRHEASARNVITECIRAIDSGDQRGLETARSNAARFQDRLSGHCPPGLMGKQRRAWQSMLYALSAAEMACGKLHSDEEDACVDSLNQVLAASRVLALKTDRAMSRVYGREASRMCDLIRGACEQR